MMILLIVTLAVFGCIAVGRTLVQMLGAGFVSSVSRVELFGLSVCAGIAGIGWISFFGSILGIPLGPEFSWGLTAFGLLSAGVLFFVSRRATQLASADKSPSAVQRVSQIIIGILIIAAVGQTLLTPQRFWDERAIYALRAKMLWYEASVNSPVLHEPDLVQFHPKYPLLLPLAEQHFYSLLGGVHDRWSKLLFPVMYAGLVLTFAGVCARRLSPSWGWFCALLLASTPVLMPYEYGFLCAQADAPVGCFHGIAVLYLWDAFQESNVSRRRRMILLSSVAATSAAFTKDEGIAFLMIDVIAFGLALFLGQQPAWDSQKESRRFGLLEWGILIGVSGLLLTPWLMHRRSLPSTTDMNYLGRMSLSLLVDRIPTLAWSVPHLMRKMFLEGLSWGLHWWLVVAALITVPARVRLSSQQFLFWNLLGALSALLVAGMVAPAELEEHLGGSTHRFLMQITPAAVLLLAAQWAPNRLSESILSPAAAMGSPLDQRIKISE